MGGSSVGTAFEQVILGNQNLKNEKIISREIVYFGEFLNSSLLFNARLFHDDITDYIDTIREDVNPTLGDNVVDDPDESYRPQQKYRTGVPEPDFQHH